MVVFTAAARADVEAADDWYGKHSPEAASRFREAMRVVIGRIEAKPWQFPAGRHHTRRALLPRFPYIVIFRETEVAVVVVAVFHTRRDPQEWRGRLL